MTQKPVQVYGEIPIYSSKICFYKGLRYAYGFAWNGGDERVWAQERTDHKQGLPDLN